LVTAVTSEAAVRRDRQANNPQFQDDGPQAGVTTPPSGEVPPGGYIPLSKLNRHVEPGPSGKRRHVSTLYRYATRGVLGIRLKTWRFPDGIRTTIPAWYEFIERLTAAVSRHADEQTVTAPRSSTKRQSLVEAEIEEVRASLGRKAARTGRGPGHAAGSRLDQRSALPRAGFG
jgi:hypothetical protein